MRAAVTIGQQQRVEYVVRFAVLAVIVIILSTLVGIDVVIFPQGEMKTPFSECDTYLPFSAPDSCKPLAYYLLALAVVLLGLVALFFMISRRPKPSDLS
jgi:hypothetical protein